MTQQPGNFSATQWSSTTLGTTSVLIEKRMNDNNYNIKSGLLIKSSRLEINAIFIVAIFIATINVKKITSNYQYIYIIDHSNCMGSKMPLCVLVLFWSFGKVVCIDADILRVLLRRPYMKHSPRINRSRRMTPVLLKIFLSSCLISYNTVPEGVLL